MSLGSDDAKKFHPIWLSFGRYEVCSYVGGGRAAWLRRPYHFAVVAAAATACAATTATTAEEKIYASSAVLLRFKP